VLFDFTVFYSCYCELKKYAQLIYAILPIKNTSRHAKSTKDILIKYTRKKMTGAVKTLALDNGIELLEYKLAAQLLQ
jgi:IS30 family transposase